MSRMPAVGDIIDDVFRVEAELDSGNFGSVYKVWDSYQQRTLALKVLRPGAHDEGELRKRFEREATLVYSLQHPHIVRVFYYGETPSQLPYMAMEFLTGTDLRSLLHQYTTLHPALVKRITLESLAALEAAHGLGIIHRDLKPANIFLVNDGGKGHVKVLDFGFAKALDDDKGSDLTNAQTLVGTPAYMAPELVHKKDVGPAADLYAIGLIMAEMLSGAKAVELENVYDTILFQASSKPVKLARAVTDSPFAKVIKQAVAKDQRKRFSTAAEFMEALRQVVVPGESRADTAPHLQDGDVAGLEAPLYMPREFGLADRDAATAPHSHGMPALHEVDRALGNTPTPRARQSSPNLAPVARQSSQGLAPVARQSSPSYAPVARSPELNARQRVRVETEPVSDFRDARGAAPLDSQQLLARQPQRVAPVSSPDSLSLDMERPPARDPRAKADGGSQEILIGVVAGVLILALALLFLRFFAY